MSNAQNPVLKLVAKYPAARTAGQDHMLCEDLNGLFTQDSRLAGANNYLASFAAKNAKFYSRVTPVTRYQWLQSMDAYLVTLVDAAISTEEDTIKPGEFILANRERRLQLGILNPEIFKSLATSDYD